MQCAYGGDDPGETSAPFMMVKVSFIIPVQTVRDLEIRIESGKFVLLKERVAIPPQVSQPILCYGRFFQGGWRMGSREQMVTHETGVKVPIELPNMSVTI